MKLSNIIICILLALSVSSTAQIIAPDTVCVNEDFVVTLEESPASKFCLISDEDSFFQDVDVKVVGEFPNNSFPLFSDPVIDDQEHYLFTTLSTNGDLVRSDFGNSYLNSPTNVVYELDLIPNGREGIQIIKDGSQWWGFIIGGDRDFSGPEFLVRLNFGNSITNTPTVENLGNIGNLRFPHDLFIAKEDDSWIGITINRASSTITRFEFGDSLGNMPTGTNLGNIGQLFSPTGFYPIHVDGSWHLFIVNTLGNSISRVDFGNSLLNVPTGIKLEGDALFDRPRDMNIFKFCQNYYGIIANRINDSEATVINLGNSILSNSYETTNDIIDGFNFPHSLTSFTISDNGYIFFIIDVASSQLYCAHIGTIACENERGQIEISYNEPGTYNFQVSTNIGTPSQTRFCHHIVVLPSPSIDLGQDTLLCNNEILELESDHAETIWQGQHEGASFQTNESGILHASLSNGFCEASDSINVTFLDCDNCIYIPNIFAPDQISIDSKFTALIGCNTRILEYELIVFNRWGEKVYTSNDETESWDGRFNNHPCPEGVYVWKLSYSYEINQSTFHSKETGDLTLFR